MLVMKRSGSHWPDCCASDPALAATAATVAPVGEALVAPLKQRCDTAYPDNPGQMPIAWQCLPDRQKCLRAGDSLTLRIDNMQYPHGVVMLDTEGAEQCPVVADVAPANRLPGAQGAVVTNLFTAQWATAVVEHDDFIVLRGGHNRAFAFSCLLNTQALSDRFSYEYRKADPGTGKFSVDCGYCFPLSDSVVACCWR